MSKSQVLRFAFYPRPPGGGRHQGISQKSNRVSDFYPRLPDGGRQLAKVNCALMFRFLSTPSGWRATRKCRAVPSSQTLFLSTPSGWRATALKYIYRHRNKFLSTPSGWRATARTRRFILWFMDFYPRPPGGGRRQPGEPAKIHVTQFLSTPSGWRATDRPI